MSVSLCMCVSLEAAGGQPLQSPRLKLNHLEQVCSFAFLCVCVCVCVRCGPVCLCCAVMVQEQIMVVEFNSDVHSLSAHQS